MSRLTPQLNPWAQLRGGGAREGGRGEARGAEFSRSPDPPEHSSAAGSPPPTRGCLSLPAQSAWESWPKVRQTPRDCSPWTLPFAPGTSGYLGGKEQLSMDLIILYLKTFNDSHHPWDKSPNPDRGPAVVWFSPRLALWPLPHPFLPLWSILSL